jgi:hypothetical protein
LRNVYEKGLREKEGKIRPVQKILPKNEDTLSDDWNYRFIKEPTRKTILEFEGAALDFFYCTVDHNKRKSSRSIFTKLSIQFAENNTKESKRLKN